MSDNNSKPVIFLAFANPSDARLSSLSEEKRQLRETLKPAEKAGLCEVVVRSDCTANDIFKVFQDENYRNRIAVFHYAGHANGYQLLLESAKGESAAADAGGFARFLGQQRGLHFVFLNGCSTQSQTKGLLEANVSIVISTSRDINDSVATEFAAHFYESLASGDSIRTSFHEAEAAVQTIHGNDTRGLYFGAAEELKTSANTDRLPWEIFAREGSESANQWNLPESADDPLFGIPSPAEQNLPESPYRHLSWFEQQHAEIFFGRGRQIRQLYDRITAAHSSPIILFYGQSGVGKSSMLAAGLFPRLEHDHDVRYLRRDQWQGLSETLRLAFFPEVAEDRLDNAWRAKEEQSGKPLVVFLDQAEEIFTRPQPDTTPAAELEKLIRVLRDTFVESEGRPRGKLVLGFRKEWLAEIEARMIENEIPRTRVFLEPLDRRGVMEVVLGPTRSARLRERYGLSVEDRIPDIIADDLLADRNSAIAPTLQILLSKMWTDATATNYEKPHFSRLLYQHLTDQGVALGDFLNQRISEIQNQYPDVVESGLLLDVVAYHTTPLGTADQHSMKELLQQYTHVSETLDAVLRQCQDLHLLTVPDSTHVNGTEATRLAHDTLAPLVRERFESSDKPGQRARRILEARVRGGKTETINIELESLDKAGQRAQKTMEAGVKKQKPEKLDWTDLKTVEQGRNGTRKWDADEEDLIRRSRIRRNWWIFAWFSIVSVCLCAIGIAVWQGKKAKENLEVVEQLLVEREQQLTDCAFMAVEVAGAKNPSDARDAYEEFFADPKRLRLISPGISAALDGIDNAIDEWGKEPTLVAGVRDSALELVRGVHEGLLQLVSQFEGSSDPTRVAIRKKSLKNITSYMDQHSEEPLNRARTVTRAIAEIAVHANALIADADTDERRESARNNKAKEMLELKLSFEQLYYAELYLLELWDKKLMGKTSPLETAMVEFRRALAGWDPEKLSGVSGEVLQAKADKVAHACDGLAERLAAAAE